MIDTPSAAAWLRLLSLALFFLLWGLLSWLLDSEFLPSPQAVLWRLGQHLYSGELLFSLAVTLLRVVAAFVLALGIGAAIGMLMGSSRRLDILLDGVLLLALNVPALVTIILCYIWLGLNETAALCAVAVNKIPMVVVTLREGARAVDKGLLEMADIYRLPLWARWRQVYLPQLYPYLLAAARNGLALIWKIVLVVELLGRSNGMGFQLATFFQFFDIASILAYTMAFVLIIWAIEALLMRPLEYRLLHWRH